MLRALLAPLLVLGLAPALAADLQQRAPMDDAIDRALDFLQRNQDPEGAWRLHNVQNPAVTSLSVMAFLSAGHVPGEGRYGQTVEKGVRWVLKKQYPNGLIATEGNHEMYHHGISTLMLAEVAGMISGPLGDEVRAKLEKAVDIILRAQRLTAGAHQGGWRYRVDERYERPPPADISVTGWQIMALRAAKNLGCDVPPERIDLAIRYIKRCQDPVGGGFRYHPLGPVTTPCTGTSILALEICGKDQHRSAEVLRAGAFLLQHPPRYRDDHFFYGVYYCSQAAFQLGGNYWEVFRPTMHEQLLNNQDASSGCWVGGDGKSRVCGPSYCTAMGVLALTVEYRFLPIYQRSEEPPAVGR